MEIRIGIHTGPVVAGVIGMDRLAFDIWGDTVNFSSRMESTGAPDSINISDRTYSRIKDFFACEHRGKILTKEKKIRHVLRERCSSGPSGQTGKPAYPRLSSGGTGPISLKKDLMHFPSIAPPAME